MSNRDFPQNSKEKNTFNHIPGGGPLVNGYSKAKHKPLKQNRVNLGSNKESQQTPLSAQSSPAILPAESCEIHLSADAAVVRSVRG